MPAAESQRVADQARLAGQVRQARNLSVSRDAPERDARHDRVDPGVPAGR